MPYSTRVIGTCSRPEPCEIDRRWAMNYAAAIDDRSDVLYDTRSGSVPVHPLILSHPEWESQKAIRDQFGLTAEEMSRGVQVTQDTRIFKPLVSGISTLTTAKVIGVHRHRAGAWATVQNDTKSKDGELLATTISGAIFRDVEVDGEDRPAALPALPRLGAKVGEKVIQQLNIPSTACHVYSECSRIWNPIHTDLGIAEEAGLPGLILHGTATIAMAVSTITAKIAGGNPTNISRVAGQLRAMVIVPTELTLTYQIHASDDGDGQVVTFDLATQSGELAIKDGIVEYSNDRS